MTRSLMIDREQRKQNTISTRRNFGLAYVPAYTEGKRLDYADPACLMLSSLLLMLACALPYRSLLSTFH